VAPDDFTSALQRPLPAPETPDGEPDFMSARRMFPNVSGRSLAILFVMMVVVLVAQVFLTDLPFTSLKAVDTAVVRLMVEDPVDAYKSSVPLAPERPLTLRFELDGEVLAEQVYAPADFASEDVISFISEHDVAPGRHFIRVAFLDAQTNDAIPLYEEVAEIVPGDILRIIYFPGITPPCVSSHCLE